MEETDRHDAVVWANLTPEEVARLASRGYGREEYKNFTYEERRAIFDQRKIK
jgi:hypothetical protein